MAIIKGIPPGHTRFAMININNETDGIICSVQKMTLNMSTSLSEYTMPDCDQTKPGETVDIVQGKKVTMSLEGVVSTLEIRQLQEFWKAGEPRASTKLQSLVDWNDENSDELFFMAGSFRIDNLSVNFSDEDVSRITLEGTWTRYTAFDGFNGVTV